MSENNNFKIVKNIIVSLSLKLRFFKSQFPQLSQFIDEFEEIKFLSTGQVLKSINSISTVSSLLTSLRLNANEDQLEGVSYDTLADFSWMNIYDGMESKHSFINGMFVSRLLGLDGYYASNRISAGLMLILPGVIYPFHTHLVKEFYYCLSGKLLIQHDIDGEKFSLGEGQISVTPEGKLHSLEVVGNVPVLLVYSWLGNLSAPIRIWEKVQASGWEGYTWSRLPNQKWRSGDCLKLSNEEFLSSFSSKKYLNSSVSSSST